MASLSSKYRLGAPLGSGGMAEVYRATLVGAEGFSRPVAIKRVLAGFSSNAEFADLLKAEARVASLLTHPNIVSVLDFDRDAEGRLFLVMELVEGRDLRALETTGRLPASAAAYVVAELLRALAHAHALAIDGRPMRIVHRDVSPHNVLLSWDGGVKLSDFGIAKAAANTQVTRSGIVKGKVAYLSPEQARADELDGRSDLFAAGIILHELLTGRRLFGVREGAPEIVILRRVLDLPIERVDAFDPSISPALADVTARLLERDRKLRYQTAEEALEELLTCPEITPRGQLDLARLMAERFPSAAPSAGRAFVETGVATPSPVKPSSTPPGRDGRRLPEQPFGGFSMVDLEAPQTPRAARDDVRISGSTLVDTGPSITDLSPTAASPAWRDAARVSARTAEPAGLGPEATPSGGLERTPRPRPDTLRLTPSVDRGTGHLTPRPSRARAWLWAPILVVGATAGAALVHELGRPGVETAPITVEPTTSAVTVPALREPPSARADGTKTATHTEAAGLAEAAERPLEPGAGRAPSDAAGSAEAAELAKRGTTEPAKGAVTEPATSGATKSGKGAATEPAKRGATEPAKSGATKSGKGAATELAKGGATEPATKPAKGGTTEPAKGGTTEPAKGGASEPAAGDVRGAATEGKVGAAKSGAEGKRERRTPSPERRVDDGILVPSLGDDGDRVLRPE